MAEHRPTPAEDWRVRALVDSTERRPGDPHADPTGAAPRRARARHTRRQLLAAGVAAGAVIGVAGPAALLRGSRPGTPAPLGPSAGQPPPSAVPTPSGPAPEAAAPNSPGSLGPTRVAGAAALAAARWRALPPVPLAPRGSGVALAWTGDRLIVWGGRHDAATAAGPIGYTDGAAYDPAGRRWALLPPAPLDARFGPGVVWTGAELVVYGGVDGHGRPLADGARYRPATRRWLSLSSAPGTAVGQCRLVWTGREVVLAPVYGPAVSTPRLPAYDPASGRWRLLPRIPLTAGFTAYGVIVMPAGSYLCAWVGSQHESTTRRDGTVVDVVTTGTAEMLRLLPAADRWAVLAPPAPLGVRTSFWTGHELLVPAALGRPPGTSGPVPIGLHGWSVDPAHGTWTALPPGPVDDALAATTWTGAALVGLTTADFAGPSGFHPGDGAAFDPTTRSWVRLPRLPGHPRGELRAATADDRVFGWTAGGVFELRA